ncbi:MAG: hypothetical protein AAF415_04920 [Pseudomonadota bacterium]
MKVIAFLWLAGGLIAMFIGKSAIASAAEHVAQTYPERFAKYARHGFLQVKAISNDMDRARRGLAGPLLIGRLPQELRDDPLIRRCQKGWRQAFLGMIACFAMAFFTLTLI